MTTVGYGDVSPQTEEGRLLAAIVMLVGIGFVAVVTGAIAQRLRQRGRDHRRQPRDVPSSASHA